MTELTGFLRQHFQLDWNGIHGANHWARVKLYGMRIAERSGADRDVVSLFAFLHDSCRFDDHGDPDHGACAADLVLDLQGRFFELRPIQLEQLVTACIGHSKGGISESPTVQTCWDADRLDLGRIGIYPDARYLSRHAAEIPGLIEWAYDLSRESIGR